MYRSSINLGLRSRPQRALQQRLVSSVDDKGDDAIVATKKEKKLIPIQAEFKNPIVATLWAARQEAKQRLGLSDSSIGGGADTTDVTKAAAKMLQQNKVGEEHSKGKPPSASKTEISYPFSTDEILKEGYENPWGEMRFGKVSAAWADESTDGSYLLILATVRLR